MVRNNWFIGTKGDKQNGNNLLEPLLLLPHGSDDEGPIGAYADNNNRRSGDNADAAAGIFRERSSDPAPTSVDDADVPSNWEHAAAQAVSKSARLKKQRASSAANNAAARQRRRRRLLDIQSRADTITRQVSNVSATSSEITRQMGNISGSGHDDDDDDEENSEISDYGSLSDDNNNNDKMLEEDLAKEKMSWGTIAKGAVVALVTGGGIASYAISFVASVTLSVSTVAISTLGVAAGVTCLLTVPLVWVSEWRLTKLRALRNRVNDLRNEAERFQIQMDFLVEEEQDLRAEMESLQQDHARLEKLVDEKNAGNVDELVELVHENQIILRQMKDNLRRVVLQDVVKLVLQSDVDRDGKLNKREANILETRLLLSLQAYGIVFDTEKFQRAVGLSPSLCGVMTIVKRLLPDENNQISTFYDKADSAADNEEEEVEDNDDDDVYDMFYVPTEDQFQKGDAESIQLCKEYLALRGKRPTLQSIAPLSRKSFKGLRCSLSSSSSD